MAIGTTAAILGGASLAAGLIGSNKQANAAKDAASLQNQAANSDRDLQKYIYEQNREDTMPWLTQGTGAVNKLGDLLGTSGNTGASGYGSLLEQYNPSQLTDDPGYQFRLAEGQKALERTQAAKGGLLSGAAVKAASAYNSGMASQEYDSAYNRFRNNQTDIYNRLAGLGNTGQTTASNLANQGQNYANNTGQAGMNAATAQGNSLIGASNAWNTGLSNAATSLGSILNYKKPDQNGIIWD